MTGIDGIELDPDNIEGVNKFPTPAILVILPQGRLVN